MCKTTEECKGPVAVFALFLTVLAGALYERVRPSIGVPASIFMILFGAIVGVIAAYGDKDWADSLAVTNFSPDLILHVFLPVLIFDSGQALKLKVLSRVTWSAVILAGPGVLMGAFSVAGLGLALYTDWTFLQCLLLGAVVAATDPVAVVATLHDLDADPFVSTLTDSEALMNDGAAIALFAIVDEMISSTHSVGVGDVVANVFRFTLMPIPLGIGFGFVMNYISRNSLTNPTVIGGVQISLAYITFYVSDVLCHTSGVLTLLIAGIFIARQRGRHPKGQAEDSVVAVWSWLVFVGNTLIFAVVGFLVVVKSAEQDWEHLGGFGVQVGHGVLLFLFLNAFRFVMMLMAWPIVDCLAQLPSDRMTWQRYIFLSAGGLRGGIAIVLGMFVLESHELDTSGKHTFGAAFFLQVAIVVILSSVINGQLSGPLVRALKLNSKEVFSFFAMRMAVQELKNASIGTLDNLKFAGRASQQMVSWLFVRSMSVHKLEEFTLEIEHEARKMAHMSDEQHKQQQSLVNKSDGSDPSASPTAKDKKAHIHAALAGTPHGGSDAGDEAPPHEPFALDATVTTTMDASYRATEHLKNQHVAAVEGHHKRHRHHHHKHGGGFAAGCCACCSESGSSSSGSSSDDDDKDGDKKNKPQEMKAVGADGADAVKKTPTDGDNNNNNNNKDAVVEQKDKSGGAASPTDGRHGTAAAIAAIVAESLAEGDDEDDEADVVFNSEIQQGQEAVDPVSGGEDGAAGGEYDDEEFEEDEEGDAMRQSNSLFVRHAIGASSDDEDEGDGMDDELVNECKELCHEQSGAPESREKTDDDTATSPGKSPQPREATAPRRSKSSVFTKGRSNSGIFDRRRAGGDAPAARAAARTDDSAGALRPSRSSSGVVARRQGGEGLPARRNTSFGGKSGGSSSSGVFGRRGARGGGGGGGGENDSNDASLQRSRSTGDISLFKKSDVRRRRGNSSAAGSRRSSRKAALAAAAKALSDKAQRVRDLLNASSERHVMAPVILKMLKRFLWIEYNQGLIHGTTAVVFSEFIDGRSQSQEPVFSAKDVLDYAHGDTHLSVLDVIERWLLPDYFAEHNTTLLVEVSIVFTGMMKQITKELPLMAKQHANLYAWQTWSKFVSMEAQAFEKHMQLKHPSATAHILSRRAAQMVLAHARQSVAEVARAYGLSTHQKAHLNDKLFDYAFESLTSTETHSIAHEIESGGNAALKLHLKELLRNTHIFYSTSEEILDMIVEGHEVVELEREGDAMWLEDSVGLVVVGAVTRIDSTTGKRVRVFRSGDIFGINAFVAEQAEPKQFFSLGNGFDEDEDADDVHDDYFSQEDRKRRQRAIEASNCGACCVPPDTTVPASRSTAIAIASDGTKINRNKVELITIKYSLMEEIMHKDSRVRHHVLMASAFDRLMPVLERSYPFSSLNTQQRRAVIVQGHVSRVHHNPHHNNSSDICSKFHTRDSLFLLRGGATDSRTGAKLKAPGVLTLPEKFNGVFEPGSVVIQLPDARLTSQRVMMTGMTFVDNAHVALDIAFTSFSEAAAQADTLKALDQLLHELHRYTHVAAVLLKLTKPFVPPPSPSAATGAGFSPSLTPAKPTGKSPSASPSLGPAATPAPPPPSGTAAAAAAASSATTGASPPLIDVDAILRVRDCIAELMRHLRIWSFHRHSGRLNRLYVAHALSAYFDLVVRRADEWAPTIKSHHEKQHAQAAPYGMPTDVDWASIEAVLTPADSYEFMTSTGFFSEGDLRSVMGWEKLSVDFEVPTDLNDVADEPSPVLVSATLPDAEARQAVFHAKSRGKMVAAAMRDLPAQTNELMQTQRLFARARVQVSHGRSLPSGTSGHDVVAPVAQTSRSSDSMGGPSDGYRSGRSADSREDVASELGQVCTELARDQFAPPALGRA